MEKDNMPVTTLYLNATNSVPQNLFLVSLMAYIDDMMGLDLENIVDQLEFVAKYARRKAEAQKNGR